jgi:hypothetical protein
MQQRWLWGGALLAIATYVWLGDAEAPPSPRALAQRSAAIEIAAAPVAVEAPPAPELPAPAAQPIPAGAEERVARVTELLRDARAHGHTDEIARLEGVLQQVAEAAR